MDIDSKETLVGYELPVLVKTVGEDAISNYSSRYLGVFLRTFHTDQEMASNVGLPGLLVQGSQIMNFSTEALFKVYREKWINDSTFSVKFIKPVFSGETITSTGKVIGRTAGSDGRIVVTISVLAEKSSGETVMAGEARVVV